MNIAQTYVAIRKRNILEILDLSFHFVRDHFVPLSILWLIGTLPFMVTNWILIGWLAEDYYDYEMMWLYFYVMFLLICSQAQVATILMTNYLGQAIFNKRPSVLGAIRSFVSTNPYWIWAHGFLRLVFPVLLIATWIRKTTDDDYITMIVVLLSATAMLGFSIRWIRPFVSEILFLEKTPIRKQKTEPVNYKIRSSSLHKAANAELTGRFVVLSFLAIPITISVLGTLLSVDFLLNLFVGSETLPVVFYGPIALWVVVGILAVTRFLSYIDIRIRQEGWEVSLRMKAEAAVLE